VRNYVEFYTARVNQGGNYVSFVAATPDAVTELAQNYVNNFGGSIDWTAAPAYLLLNKGNAIALLVNWVTHYQAAFGSTWHFLQDGLIAKSSPKKTWSHGE